MNETNHLKATTHIQPKQYESNSQIPGVLKPETLLMTVIKRLLNNLQHWGNWEWNCGAVWDVCSFFLIFAYWCCYNKQGKRRRYGDITRVKCLKEQPLSVGDVKLSSVSTVLLFHPVSPPPSVSPWASALPGEIYNWPWAPGHSTDPVPLLSLFFFLPSRHPVRSSFKPPFLS